MTKKYLQSAYFISFCFLETCSLTAVTGELTVVLTACGHLAQTKESFSYLIC